MIDVTKQPPNWSDLYGRQASEAEPTFDLQGAEGMPAGFRMKLTRKPSKCRHENNPGMPTFCRYCGVRIAP